jgi:hypothetical protein
MNDALVTHHRWAVPAVGLIIALAGAVALARIPDSQNVIHGCYDRLKGTLRVIDSENTPPDHCTPNETSLSWNQQGPVGPAGPQGPQGPI